MKAKLRRPVAVACAAALTLAACGSETTTEAGDGVVPSVTIDVQPDPVSGHNLFIELEDFTVSPENASTEPVDGEGHMHLYIDGERVMRFYNTALHLADLGTGEHVIEVELSQNDHSAYEDSGEEIRASQTITVHEGPHGADAEAEHDEAAGRSHDEGHDHGTDVIDTELDPAPTISLEVTKDPKSGWNLAIATANFTLVPQAASTELVDGEGHMHLYVDGKKVTRLYGNNWHLSKLAEGTRTIEVELSHHNHAAYGIDGEPIRASVEIEVTAEEAAGTAHSHSHEDDSHGHSHDSDAGADDPATVADADVRVNASFTDGEVDVADDRVEVELGSIVAVVVEADVDEDLHVHGYDRYASISPGEPGTVAFTADVPGVFEVELEGSGTFLFEVQVS